MGSAPVPQRRGPAAAPPRWVKVSVGVFVLLVIVVVAHLTGNSMGSAMHMAMTGAGG